MKWHDRFIPIYIASIPIYIAFIADASGSSRCLLHCELQNSPSPASGLQKVDTQSTIVNQGKRAGIIVSSLIFVHELTAVGL